MSPVVVLRVRGLTKRYRHVSALEDVGFTARAGEVLGVIGPNGAGKTTLFECVAGLMPFDAGVIALEDRSGRNDLFYLPDAVAPWASQRVGWALDFVIGFFGGPAVRRHEMVAALQLAPLLDRTIGTLSKGERKRALLAMAVLTPRRILLADEPFDGLDLKQLRQVAALLRAEAARGRTLCLSIHHIADAARVCDRFVLLSSGRVRGEGTLDELHDRAAISGMAVPTRSLEETFLALT